MTSSGKEREDVIFCLQSIGSLVDSEGFKKMKNDFLASNSSTVDFNSSDDQWKGLHKQYVDLVNAHLQNYLSSKGKSLDFFRNHLDAYVKEVSAPDQDVGDDVARAIELFQNMDDLFLFKTILISYKSESEKRVSSGTCPYPLDAGCITSKDSSLQNVSNKLCDVAKLSGDWTTIIEDSETKVEVMRERNRVRGAIVVELGLEDGLEMILSMDIESVKWRTPVKKISTVQEVEKSGNLPKGVAEDVIVHMDVQLPLVFRYLPLVPNDVTFRAACQKTENIFNWLTVGWDAESNCEQHGTFSFAKSGTLRVDPNNNSRCVMSFVQEGPQWMPSWLLKVLIKLFLRQRINTMIQQYKNAKGIIIEPQTAGAAKGGTAEMEKITNAAQAAGVA